MRFKSLFIFIFVGIILFSTRAAAQEGCEAGDCENGFGTYRFDEGVYTGYFLNSQQEGQGTFTWLNGQQYIGLWRNGKQHGEATVITNGVKRATLWEDGVFIKDLPKQKAPTTQNPTLVTDVSPDTQAPRITLISPSANRTRGIVLVTNEEILEVRGKVTDNEGIKSVLVNDKKAVLTAPGSIESEFTLSMKFSNGQNKLVIQAVDINGNVARTEYSIHHQAGMPSENSNTSNSTASSTPTPPKVYSTAPATSGKRTALVIGNSSYPTAVLRNAVNDADSIATELSRIGFEVLHYENLGQNSLEDAIKEFGIRLKKKGGAGLVYYAGHGVQLDGQNYLVPTDATIQSEADIKNQTVDLAMIMQELEMADNKFNILILDACRNNPFATSIAQTRALAARAAKPTTIETDGLAAVNNAPAGTFIAYSTAPGSVASDGNGSNSLYTEALLKALRVRGLKLEDVFKLVRKEVRKASGNAQIPWENSSIEGDFYFRK